MADAEEPYAYIQYRKDSIKRLVPVSFFENSESFDIKNFSSTKQYWVFWANDGKETPQTFLQEHSTIPKIENSDVETVQTGYYRATVSVAAASERDLQNRLTHKRAREVPTKYLEEGSFDAGNNKTSSSQQNSELSRKSSTSNKKGNKTKDKKLKKYGSLHNVNELLRNTPFTSSSADYEKCLKGSDKILQKKRAAHKKNISNLSSDDSDSDPDFAVSPSKVKRLEADLAEKKAAICRMRHFNEELQEILINKEETLKQQDSEIKKLKGQLAISAGSINSAQSKSNTNNKEPKIKQEQSTVIELSVSGISCGSNSNQKESDKPKEPITLLCSPAANQASPATLEVDNNVEDIEPFADVQLLDVKKSEESAACVQQEIHGASFIQGDMEIRHGTDNDGKMVGDNMSIKVKPGTGESRKGKVAVFKPLFSHLQDYTLYPGKILNARLIQYVFSKAASGPKGDSLYTKMMALVAWGAEHLASHTVKGGVNPKLSKTNPHEALEQKRAPLDADRLVAVQKALIFKLKAEGVRNPEVDERVKKAKVHGYIRDKIKTLRQSGFGQGKSTKSEEEEQMAEFASPPKVDE